MIREIFYTDKMTYINDMKENQVFTNNLGFGKSFELARNLDAQFNFESIDNDDIIDLSHYFQYKVGDCQNRNIYDFFNKCKVLGIHNIVGDDVFGEKAMKETITIIINDYNADVALYNIEAYGTDNYISKIVLVHLQIAQNFKKKNESKVMQINSLLKLVERDTYDLDEFLKLLKIFNNDEKDTKLIEDLKCQFNKDYDHTSEAIEWYIETLVTYGGDSSHKIFKAMNEVFDDIINNKPFCDKAGLIEYLKEK